MTPAYGQRDEGVVHRQGHHARNDGQFGVAFRYIAEELNSTEFGFYFVNYHSKEPTLYADIGDYAGADLAALANTLRPIAGNLAEALANGLVTADVMGNINARREFAEDIRMYGFSFNTTVGDASVFGELAYRPNLPIGIAATNDLIGDLAHGAAEAPTADRSTSAGRWSASAGRSTTTSGSRRSTPPSGPSTTSVRR